MLHFQINLVEYIAAGLNIIISSSLIDQTAITKKYELGLIYDNINDIDINEIELFKRYRLKNLQNYYKNVFVYWIMN